TATGDGKSALFTVPILCHLAVSQAPNQSPKFRAIRRHPVGVVITPTKGLARNIVETFAEYNVSALAYDRGTIVHAASKSRNLGKEVASYHFHVICIDPEHLKSSSWFKIFDELTFQENLIFVSVEEVHLLHEWLTFRRDYDLVGQFLTLDYDLVGQFLCGRLRTRVSVFGLSATLEPGLLPYLNTGRKVVVFVPALEIGTRLFIYLLRLDTSGRAGHRIRQYNALCHPNFNSETLRLMETDPGNGTRFVQHN
ncbi:hypothetical protein DFH08DRAFT_702834, partial [Mycena albidolilacea]